MQDGLSWALREGRVGRDEWARRESNPHLPGKNRRPLAITPQTRKSHPPESNRDLLALQADAQTSYARVGCGGVGVTPPVVAYSFVRDRCLPACVVRPDAELTRVRA